MTQYPEYFVSYYAIEHKNRILCYCCRIGGLSIAEVALFKRASGIKDNPDFVLHKEISPISTDYVANKVEHIKALEEFALAIHERRCQWSHRTHISPAIEKLVEYQEFANDIRKERGLGSVSAPLIMPQPVDVVNSKPVSQPKIELDTEDLADKVARLIKENKGCWKQQNTFADAMVDDDKDRFPTRKTALKVLRHNR